MISARPNSRLMMVLCFFISISLSSMLLAGEKERKVYGPAKKRIKFGVVVNNSEYKIYRSAALGRGGLKTLRKHLRKNALPFPKTIVYMNKGGYKFPFYFALHEYLAEQSGEFGDFDFFHSFGNVRTYLDGVDPYNPSEDIDQEGALGSEASEYFDLRDDGLDGGMDALKRILDIVLDESRQPVLFHCFGGRHRTGMVAMILRYLQGGWWVDKTYKRRRGIDMNPAQYEYYKYNHLLFRRSNIEFVKKFSKSAQFAELKETYGPLLQPSH